MNGGPVHAFGDDALGDADATEVARLVASGAVSPAEVCEAAIRRAEAVEPFIGAVEAPDYERALATARAEPPREGAFAGVPTYVKDNVDVAGLPTGHGTDAFTPRAATADGPFVGQLRAQGLLVLGKSRLPEFGFSASTEYARRDPVRNPWNLDHSAGASSGGSAALVAAGVVPIAHANDGGGSTRIPAAACGLVGLKPTRGRLVADAADTRLPVRITSQGVLTRTVRDTARFYAAAEEYRRNPALPPIRSVSGPSRTRLRVGVVVDSVIGPPVDAETRACVLETAELLSGLRHRVEESPLPVSKQFAEDFSLYWGLLGLLVTAAGTRVLDPGFDVSRTDNLTRGLAQMCRRRLPQVPAMLVRLRRSTRAYREIFTHVDVLLSPVLGHTTPPLGHLSPTLPFEELFPRLQSYVAFTPLNNATGGPAISLPLGRTSSGLPLGVHLSADHGDERTLLELAYELEEARPWSRIQDVTGPGVTGLDVTGAPPT